MEKPKHPGGRPKKDKKDLGIYKCVIKYSKNQAEIAGGVDILRRLLRHNAKRFLKNLS
jgi:hypothetical protein